MNLRVLSAALVLLYGTACAAPRLRESQLTGWHSVEADDLRIVGQTSAYEVEQLADDLAFFDAAFAHLIGQRLAAIGPPTTIYLFRDWRLSRYFGLGGGVGGWALPDALEGSMATVLLRRHLADARQTLFHEYTHLLLGRSRRAPLPRWYHEGLASYFGTLSRRDGAVIVGAPPSSRLPWIAAHGPMSLERLFESSVWSLDWEEINDFYATSWALCHYLLSSPEGRQQLSRFREQLERGVPAEEARHIAFGGSLEQLEEDLTTHVGYLARLVPVEIVLDERRILVSELPGARPVAAAQVARELGELALARDADGRLALARRLLQMAAAANPDDPRTQGALAEVQAKSGDLVDAQITIENALGNAPDDLGVRLYAGRTALACDQPSEAEEHFRYALRLDERSAPAWFGLGRVLVRADRRGDALAAFEQARRFGWSPALDLAIGRLHLAAERNEEAREMLWPLAQDPHGGETGQEAAKLLQGAGLVPGAGDDPHRGESGSAGPGAR